MDLDDKMSVKELGMNSGTFPNAHAQRSSKT
jgi:hypothetical protein